MFTFFYLYIKNAAQKAAFKNLTEDTDFVKDLKINSANLVDIILDIEDAFDIRLENEDMEQMLDVKSAMSIVKSKLEA